MTWKQPAIAFANAFMGSLITLWAGVTADTLPDIRVMGQMLVAAVIAGLVGLMTWGQALLMEQKNGNGVH